jgi:hypothetical protein
VHLPAVIQPGLVVTDILQKVIAGVLVYPVRFQEKAVALEEIVHLALVEAGAFLQADELRLTEVKGLLFVILNDDVELQVVCGERGNLAFVNPLVSAEKTGYPSLKREAAALVPVANSI